jgi:hypothetical protein
MKRITKYNLPVPDNEPGVADDPADIHLYATELANAVEAAVDSRAVAVSEHGSFPVYQHETDGAARNFPIRLEWRGKNADADGISDTSNAWTIRVRKLNGGATAFFNLARNDGHNTEIGSAGSPGSVAGRAQHSVVWQAGDGTSLPDLIKGAVVSSTRRVKRDITPLTEDAPLLPDPVTFRYLPDVDDTGQLIAGFIAEDVPDVAQVYDSHGDPAGVDARALVALLTVEVRRLADRVRELEERA